MRCFLLSLILLCGCGGGTITVYDGGGNKHEVNRDKIVTTTTYTAPDGSGDYTVYSVEGGRGFLNRDPRSEEAKKRVAR